MRLLRDRAGNSREAFEYFRANNLREYYDNVEPLLSWDARPTLPQLRAEMNKAYEQGRAICSIRRWENWWTRCILYVFLLWTTPSRALNYWSENSYAAGHSGWGADIKKFLKCGHTVYVAVYLCSGPRIYEQYVKIVPKKDEPAERECA